ncbi:hypothetical protein [Mesorhizobium mediterraneum]|uniref:hypothetical protein n=1 Tax=Mesorhizobium mediterraneum TaxID=43617 RepID=UPI00177B5DBF|nr:hypothetical protein [Mesorhizobium mediterraneum]
MTSRRIVLVRHGDDPPDDRVYTFAVQYGFEPVVCRPFRGHTLGEPHPSVAGSVMGSVIYGGHFNAFDAEIHPFLQEEYRWIDACLKAHIPLLGICQGAQMGRFYPNESHDNWSW